MSGTSKYFFEKIKNFFKNLKLFCFRLCLSIERKKKVILGGIEMFCMKCGKKLPDDSKFCPFCGAPSDHGAQKGQMPRKDNSI